MALAVGLAAVPAAARTAPPALSGISVHYGPAAGNTRVVVHGHGFTSVRAVYFGVHKASYYRVPSSSELIARSPRISGDEAVHIRVRTSAGTSAYSRRAIFTYVAAPRVTGLSRHGSVLAGGVRVTVTGRNFRSVGSVTLTGARASDVHVESPTTLTMVTPAHAAGSVSVFVTTRYGTSANTSADNYRYEDLPVVDRVFPPDGSASGGDVVDIDGQNLLGTIAVDFDGTPATNVYAERSSEVVATTPARAAGAATVTVTTASGTSQPSDSAMYNYTVPNPDSWSARDVNDVNRGQMKDISCPSAGNCVAIDDTTATTMTDGKWGKPVTVDPGGDLHAVSCPSADFCTAVEGFGGDVFQRVGDTWSGPVNLTDNSDGLSDVSCPSAQLCFALGEDVLFEWSNGSWTALPKPVTGQMSSVSCATEAFCVLTDFDGDVSTWDGTDWGAAHLIDQDEQYGDPFVSDVSCGSPTFCMLVDEYGRAIEWNGSRWEDPVAIIDDDLLHVGCDAAGYCAATALGGQAATFDGTSWHVSADSIGPPLGPGGLDEPELGAVACDSEAHCIVVDVGGDTIGSDGAQWSAPAPTFETVSDASSLSCPDTRFCVASDFNGNVYTDRNGTWSAPDPVLPAFSQQTGVSCASRTFCMLVSASGSAATYDGTAWTPVTAPPSALETVSCVSPTACVGPGATFDGRGWHATPAPHRQHSGTTISCATATFCAYGDSIWNGTTWTQTNFWEDSVSCPVADMCVGIGDTGARVYTHGNWATRLSLSDDTIEAVSCVSTTFCAVVNSRAFARTFDGTAWSTPTAMYSSGARLPFAWTVSCSAADTCAAMGRGTLYTSQHA